MKINTGFKDKPDMEQQKRDIEPEMKLWFPSTVQLMCLPRIQSITQAESLSLEPSFDHISNHINHRSV